MGHLGGGSKHKHAGAWHAVHGCLICFWCTLAACCLASRTIETLYWPEPPHWGPTASVPIGWYHKAAITLSVFQQRQSSFPSTRTSMMLRVGLANPYPHMPFIWCFPQTKVEVYGIHTQIGQPYLQRSSGQAP
eukprot:1160720-Pelagomonas_calceolata.AAC.15